MSLTAVSIRRQDEDMENLRKGQEPSTGGDEASNSLQIKDSEHLGTAQA